MSDQGPPNPADLWEHLIRAGLSKADATRHVLRVVGNTPEKIQADYLKQVDPGKLASFGLGAADMASFGLGDQAARAIWGKAATDTQQAAEQLHPTAHLAGEVAGIAGPAVAEQALAKLGLLVPSAIGTAVRGIQNVAGRAVAKTALNATVGAGLGAAQAAGRTEGGLAPRLEAAEQGAIPGAVVGVALPVGAAMVGAAGSSVMRRLAGPAAAKVVSKLLPVAATTGKNVATALAKSVPGLAEADAQNLAEAAVRAELKRLNVHPELAERTVQAWKTGKVPQAPIDLPAQPTASRVGETITPMEPQLPRLRAEADPRETQAAYMRAGNPRGLPPGRGPAQPAPWSMSDPLLGATAQPASGAPVGVAGTLQALEQQLGRPLTPPETQSVLERLLGPPGRLPSTYGRPP